MNGQGPDGGGLSSTGYGEIARIYTKITNSLEFRLLFADRIQKQSEHAAYGFSSNYDRKNWVVGSLQYALGKNFITFHDDKTLHQLQNYIRLGQWEFWKTR